MREIPESRNARLKETREESGQNRAAGRRIALVMITGIFSALTLFGCSPTPTGNSNANLNANGNANANSNSSTAGTVSLNTREPERYSAKMTLSAQGNVNNRQGSIPPVQFDFAKIGADRRWGFQMQPVGPVIYLEKAGLKYLILPQRTQYVELTPEALGFQMGNLMTPSTMIEQLKGRTQYENLGSETVDGRTATKYRFAGAADTRTQAGTVQADSFVWVDESTGLPLRADINVNTTSGEAARIMIETKDIQLSPDATQFDVPTGLRKVTTQELQQQIQGFVSYLRFFVEFMRQQQAGGAAPPPPPPANANQSTANANQPAANANR